MLEREYSYYKANKNKLLQDYKGKVIAIVGEEIVGSFTSEIEAYKAMREKYEAGKYLLQSCVPKEARRIGMYHSRVAFR